MTIVKHKIIKNYFDVLFGTLVHMAYGLMIIYIIKIFQNQQDYEALILIFRYATVLAPLMLLGMGVGIVKMISQSSNQHDDQFDGNIWCGVVVVAIMAVCIELALLLSQFMNVWWSSHNFQQYTNLVVLYSFGVALVGLADSVSKGKRIFKQFNIYSTFSILIPSLIAAYVLRGVDDVILTIFVVNFLGAIVYLHLKTNSILLTYTPQFHLSSLSRVPVDVLYPLITVSSVYLVQMRFGQGPAAEISVQLTIAAGSLIAFRPLSTVVLVNLTFFRDQLNQRAIIFKMTVVAITLVIFSTSLLYFLSKIFDYNYSFTLSIVIGVSVGLQAIYYMIRSLVDGLYNYSLLSIYSVVSFVFILVYGYFSKVLDMNLVVTFLVYPIAVLILVLMSVYSIIKKPGVACT